MAFVTKEDWVDDVRSWCEEDIVIIGYTRPNLPSCSLLIGNLYAHNCERQCNVKLDGKYKYKYKYKLRTIVNGSAM